MTTAPRPTKIERHYACPRCERLPGEPCQSPSGRQAKQPHEERLMRAGMLRRLDTDDTDRAKVAEPIEKLAARVARADARLEAALIDTWRTDVVARATALDAENDKGGHDWHSLWTGFCLGIRRPDLTSYEHYMKLGFPVECQEPQKV